ncbi:MAG TPA: WhiB family transcriptional regulator, partial [Acidimicrobiales bacterium]|nr:WhiB family transcriptional regulator [Acidimicrobiales bacterium]
MEAWRLRASCRSVDPDLFFPVGTTGLAVEQIDAAKTVCQA